MGWNSFDVYNGFKPSQWVKENYNTDSHKLIKSCVKFGVIYAAIKEIETNNVYCAVILYSLSKNEFCYKSMSEHAGPFKYDCPLSIINLLSPLEDNELNELAINWRKKVIQYHEKKSKLKTGIIKTKNMISFTNGSEYQYFKKEGRITYAGYMDDNEFIYGIRVRLNVLIYEHEIL